MLPKNVSEALLGGKRYEKITAHQSINSRDTYVELKVQVENNRGVDAKLLATILELLRHVRLTIGRRIYVGKSGDLYLKLCVHIISGKVCGYFSCVACHVELGCSYRSAFLNYPWHPTS